MRIAMFVALLALVSCHTNRQPQSPSAPTREPRAERDVRIEMFARSYFPGRSGQIFLVAEKGNFFLSLPDDVYRYMHGSPWEYDVQIPLFFYGGPFVARGVFSGPARQQDVAPTILALLGVPAPSTMTGRALRQAVAPSSEKPAVVFLAVLDGLGADTLARLEPRLSTLSRLLRDGASFPDAAIDYLPTVTSAGHATVATGTDPRFHGIPANATFDRRTGKSDEPFPGMSPMNYRALTLADHWNLATSGRAVILAQGTTPRAAVALAGHGSCSINGRSIVMTMFDERKAGWVTNADCFRMPPYLEDDHAAKLWEKAGGTWMGHKVDSGRTLLRTPFFSRFQVDALLEMIEKESLGRDAIPDLLLVNFKTPDYVAHQYGPASAEMAESMVALDAELARVLEGLDRATGPGRYVVAVTADHGMPPEPAGSDQARRYVEDILASVHARFDPEKRLVLDFDDAANCQMYIDLARLEELKLSLHDVAAFLEELPFIRFAITEDEVRASAVR